MQYIKLEDVQKILSKTSDKYQSEYTWWWIAWKIQEDINSLPSISFEEMIKEKLKMCKAQASDSERHFWWMVVCEQLLNKLPK